MSASRNSTLHTKALLTGKTSTAHFPLRMPRSDGLMRMNEKMVGRPESLVARAKPVKVSYGLSASLRCQSNYYDFSTVDLFGQNKTMDTVSTILGTHLGDNFTQYFDAFERLPRITLEEVDDGSGERYFSVDLPPRTAIYSGYEGFFYALGFQSNVILNSSSRLGISKARGRGKPPPPPVKVFGLFNGSDDVIVYKGEGLGPGDTPHVILASLAVPPPPLPGAAAAPPPVFTAPRDIRVQVFVDNPLDVDFVVPGAELPFSQTYVIKSFEHLFERVRERFGLRQTPIEVAIASKDSITMTSRMVVMKDNDAVLNITFNESTSMALRLPKDRPISFVLSRPHAFVLETRGREELNPFEGHYPLSIMCHGFGTADCWVSGRGFMSTLGIVREGLPVISNGAIFETDHMTLRLELFDATMTPLSIDYDVELYMIMRFTRLSD